MGVGAEGYQRVAALADLPDGGCLAIDVDGRPVVLVRLGDEVRALENSCPHAGAPLSEGFIEGRLLTCAWHGARWPKSQNADGGDLLLFESYITADVLSWGRDFRVRWFAGKHRLRL